MIIIQYIVNENSISDHIFSKEYQLYLDDKLLLYPIKDIENNIYGVIEVMNKNPDLQNLEGSSILDVKNEIILSFISKTLGIFCSYYNYIN